MMVGSRKNSKNISIKQSRSYSNIFIALELNHCKTGKWILRKPNILISMVGFNPRVHIKRILIEFFPKMNRHYLFSLEFPTLQSHKLKLKAQLLMTLHTLSIVKTKNVFLIFQRRAVEDLLNRSKRRSSPISRTHACYRTVKAFNRQFGRDKPGRVNLTEEELYSFVVLCLGGGEAGNSLSKREFVSICGCEEGDHEVESPIAPSLENSLFKFFLLVNAIGQDVDNDGLIKLFMKLLQNLQDPFFIARSNIFFNNGFFRRFILHHWFFLPTYMLHLFQLIEVDDVVEITWFYLFKVCLQQSVGLLLVLSQKNEDVAEIDTVCAGVCKVPLETQSLVLFILDLQELGFTHLFFQILQVSATNFRPLIYSILKYYPFFKLIHSSAVSVSCLSIASFESLSWSLRFQSFGEKINKALRWFYVLRFYDQESIVDYSFSK